MCVSGLFLSYNGHQQVLASKRVTDVPLQFTSRPPLGACEQTQLAGMVRRAMSHMKATISRAMAVVTTVDFLTR